jgi:hypothetical protein
VLVCATSQTRLYNARQSCIWIHRKKRSRTTLYDNCRIKKKNNILSQERSTVRSCLLTCVQKKKTTHTHTHTQRKSIKLNRYVLHAHTMYVEQAIVYVAQVSLFTVQNFSKLTLKKIQYFSSPFWNLNFLLSFRSYRIQFSNKPCCQL